VLNRETLESHFTLIVFGKLTPSGVSPSSLFVEDLLSETDVKETKVNMLTDFFADYEAPWLRVTSSAERLELKVLDAGRYEGVMDLATSLPSMQNEDNPVLSDVTEVHLSNAVFAESATTTSAADVLLNLVDSSEFGPLPHPTGVETIRFRFDASDLGCSSATLKIEPGSKRESLAVRPI
jgi:hypothetical protein